MTDTDEWGRDPAVRVMRKIFRAMDDAQKEFFVRMEIDRYDLRIRSWREKALALFETAFSRLHRTGIAVSEDAASSIYILCLAKIMRAQGIVIPKANLPDKAGAENILREIL